MRSLLKRFFAEGNGVALLLHNTLKGAKETFEPLNPKEVRIYTCGPTVYDLPHLGNMRAYVFADTLNRILRYNGYKVKHVINITDVGHLTDDADEGEDKIEKQAKKQNKNAQEIAQEITQAFFDDLSALNVPLEAYEFPRATEYVQEQILFVKSLEEKGYTYKTKDGIYFDTSLFKDYGKLGNIDIENLKEGARVESKEKKNKTDFALWKFSNPNEKRQQEWDSPWGKGFPGWHIECSAMSRVILGKVIDIHTGGIDHIPVHHNNEIAQSEALLGKPFVKYWMHVAFLNLDNEKISKSKGNIVTVSDLAKDGMHPLTYRYFLHTAHYRKEVSFSKDALLGAQRALERLQNFVKAHKDGDGNIINAYKKRFLEKINDDLSMPEAVALIWDMLKDKKYKDSDKVATLLDFDKVLGLGLENLPGRDTKSQEVVLPAELKQKLQERQKARENKDWKKADEIRDAFEKQGFKIIDTEKGQKVDKL